MQLSIWPSECWVAREHAAVELQQFHLVDVKEPLSGQHTGGDSLSSAASMLKLDLCSLTQQPGNLTMHLVFLSDQSHGLRVQEAALQQRGFNKAHKTLQSHRPLVADPVWEI